MIALGAIPAPRTYLHAMQRLTKAFLFLLVTTVAGVAEAQVTIYRTPAEYQAGGGEDVGDFVDIVPVMGQYNLSLLRDGEKHRVRCKDIWGFTYKGVLFRITEEGHLPVRLMTKGSLCYYENGFAHLVMIRDGTELESFDVGNRSYLSRHLEGEVVPAVFKEGDTRSSSARFRQAHSQFEPLFQCIGDRDDLEHTRQCVVDFEVALEGR